MTLTRPPGRILPVADATMSIVPHQAQINATENRRIMALPIARPTGDGGVSTISSAAGRNASSSRRLGRGPRNGTTRCAGGCAVAGSADFMESSLQSVQRSIAAAGFNQCVVAAVLDQAA